LPQQIMRHLDAIGNYAIRTHRENARQTLIFSFGNSLVVAALDFNIYQLTAPGWKCAAPCPSFAAIWQLSPQDEQGSTGCRTAVLGGHVEQSDDCGATRIAYNSCRNRHCPKCQGLARAKWLADRQAGRRGHRHSRSKRLRKPHSYAILIRYIQRYFDPLYTTLYRVRRESEHA
jgi:hypothetical protein